MKKFKNFGRFVGIGRAWPNCFWYIDISGKLANLVSLWSLEEAWKKVVWQMDRNFQFFKVIYTGNKNLEK